MYELRITYPHASSSGFLVETSFRVVARDADEATRFLLRRFPDLKVVRFEQLPDRPAFVTNSSSS